ncbi:MAG: hypothetical protein ACRELB_23100, partial [Polyangiaceae bacterium]
MAPPTITATRLSAAATSSLPGRPRFDPGPGTARATEEYVAVGPSTASRVMRGSGALDPFS